MNFYEVESVTYATVQPTVSEQPWDQKSLPHAVIITFF